jgi:hypothetical protein
MMAEKEQITNAGLLRISRNDDTRSFLKALEALDANRITSGMWNKLYALVAIARKNTNINYWVYAGTLNCYDVTDRSVTKRTILGGSSILDIIRGKK